MVLRTTATILNGCARHCIDMQFEVLTRPGDEATVDSLALVEVPQTRALFTDVAAAIAWLTPTAA